MRIGEVAAAVGISRDGLRFYERLGLIQARRQGNGYRDYPDETVHLLGYIRTAQRLGFSLNEIGANLILVRHAVDPDAALAQLLAEKLEMIESKIAELGGLRDELRARLKQNCPLALD